MRILGVTKKWPKLKKPRWTTFRLRRRDKDWQEGEIVQVVYQQRSKQREFLGIAKIIKKELCAFDPCDYPVRAIKEKEAREDGFDTKANMFNWFLKTHGNRILREPLNKLTMENMAREQ